MTFAVILLFVTMGTISFLWRNWDKITITLSYDQEKKLKIAAGIFLGMCFLGVLYCSLNGMYDYR